MTQLDLNALIKTPEYAFLHDDPRLGERIILLTLGGSHAYGTDVEDSDIDLRGIALNTPESILGFGSFDQVVNNTTDTTVYSFAKIIPLLLSCNPNTIEMLGCNPEHYVILTEQGRQLLENRGLFLSMTAADSFGGYAAKQLSRIENMLARNGMPQAQKEQHIMRSMEGTLRSFDGRYMSYDSGSIELFLDASDKEDLETEIFLNVNLKHCPVRNMKSMMNELSNVLDSYEKPGHRNQKATAKKLCKHAMHLVRLYHMGFDILERGVIATYREADREELLDIRNGKFLLPDETLSDDFFEMVHDLESRLQYDKANSSLPAAPDMKRVEEFVMDVNLFSVGGKK